MLRVARTIRWDLISLTHTHTPKHTLHALTQISLFDVCRRMKMRIQMRLGGMGEKESEKHLPKNVLSPTDLRLQ